MKFRQFQLKSEVNLVFQNFERTICGIIHFSPPKIKTYKEAKNEVKDS